MNDSSVWRDEISLLICRRQPLDQILGRSMEDLKSSSPQGSGSPGTPSANDRAAAKRAELRRQEQERRRREAVSKIFYKSILKLGNSLKLKTFPNPIP